MLIYQVAVTFFPLYMLIVTLLNFVTMRSLATYGFQTRFNADAPLVSILVPARNEAGNISHCVRSLLNQDYPNFEVVVLDDSSEDATVSIVEMLMLPTEDPRQRLRLLRGDELPEGWLGKNFACHQLAQNARGDYFLFTDADTSHNHNALSSAMAALHIEDAQFLSIFPAQQTVTLAERLAIPLVMKVFTYGLLPTWLVARSNRASLSAANGQYMLFEREAYRQIGGHAAVRGVLLEDVFLGRRIKQAGLKQILPEGNDSVSCRMYHSGGEVWRGYSKNIFAFFNYDLGWLLLFLVANLLAFVAPYGWLLAGWLTHQPPVPEWLWLPLAHLLIGWLLRLLVSVRYNFRISDTFLQPLSVLFVTAIALNSVRWSRQATEWKGRKYRLNVRS